MQLLLPLVLDEPAVAFVRHRRARRYILRLLDDGSLRVTLPRWGSKREALRFIEASRRWIADQQVRRHEWPHAVHADEAVLRRRAAEELPRQLSELAARHGIAVGRVSVRNQRSRWGSCSPRGAIMLNWRLVLVPDFVREYVMLHELMHRHELNHSPRFWRLVAAVCPRLVDARRWLRLEGTRLF
ncbi:MAG: M48 family metallopeptidase [Acidobacteriota bacterium]|nr:M48 family metallopeptidase [Acidobacteriota bacterium]